tara:strand:+ start:3496 stop:4158 length:663 start_codon:yes stop_codon:yes gene_type:complete
MNKTNSVLFLTAANDPWANEATDFLRTKFENHNIYHSDWEQKFPPKLITWEGDYIISFISRWIVPQKVLENAKLECLNFHPGPPEYPGIGCTNFAIYEGASKFGVTCHRMHSKVDTGEILRTQSFPIGSNETIEKLHHKTRNALLDLFKDVLTQLAENKFTCTNLKTWTRKPFTRKQLDALGQIDVSMDSSEVSRRIRATSFKNWQPYIDFHGFRFSYKP